MCEGFCRIIELGERPLQVCEGNAPLISDEKRSEQGGEHDDKKRRAKADCTADLDKQGYLNQRDADKGQEQPHFLILLCCIGRSGLDPVADLHKCGIRPFPCLT